MTIQIQIKNVYGKEMIYPVCDTAKLLLNLTGRKTFYPEDLNIIRKLGYQVELPQFISLTPVIK